eukprot:jgi/Bigna1/137753/aug1.41_g12461
MPRASVNEEPYHVRRARELAKLKKMKQKKSDKGGSVSTRMSDFKAHDSAKAEQKSYLSMNHKLVLYWLLLNLLYCCLAVAGRSQSPFKAESTPDTCTVWLCQVNHMRSADLEEEVEAMMARVKAEGLRKRPDFLVFPENSALNVKINPYLKKASELAKRHSVYIILGTTTSEEYDQKEQKWKRYITCFVLNRSGDLAATYHKQRVHEFLKNRFSEGQHCVFFDTEFGKASVLICLDIEVDNWRLLDKVLEEKPVLLFNPVFIPGNGVANPGARTAGMGHVSLGTERKLCLANCTLIRTDSPAGLGSSQLISSLGYTVHGYSASSHVMEFSFPAPLQSGIWRQLKETDCIRSRCSDNTGSRCRVRRFQQSAFPKKSNSHLGKRTTPQVPMCVAGSRANPNVVAFGGGEDNGGGGRICVLNTANMEILAEFTTKAPVSSLCFLSHIDSKMKGNQENVLATLTNDGTLSAFSINLMKKKKQQQQPKTFISPIAEKSIWEILSIASSNEDEKDEVSVNGKQQKHEDVSSDATTTTTDKLNKNSSIVGKIIPHPHDEGSCLYYVCSAAAASESSSKKKKKIQGAVVRLTYCSSKKENMMGVKRCSSVESMSHEKEGEYVRYPYLSSSSSSMAVAKMEMVMKERMAWKKGRQTKPKVAATIHMNMGAADDCALEIMGSSDAKVLDCQFQPEAKWIWLLLQSRETTNSSARKKKLTTVTYLQQLSFTYNQKLTPFFQLLTKN